MSHRVTQTTSRKWNLSGRYKFRSFKLNDNDNISCIRPCIHPGTQGDTSAGRVNRPLSSQPSPLLAFWLGTPKVQLRQRGNLPKLCICDHLCLTSHVSGLMSMSTYEKVLSQVMHVKPTLRKQIHVRCLAAPPLCLALLCTALKAVPISQSTAWPSCEFSLQQALS